MRKVLFALAAIGGVLAPFAARGPLVRSRWTSGPATVTRGGEPPDQRSAGGGPEVRAPMVAAEQLAQWIHDGKPGLRILDGRSQVAYDWYHIPGAERTTTGTIIVVADGREFELRGGMQAWVDMLQRPGALSRYFGGPPRRGGC